MWNVELTLTCSKSVSYVSQSPGTHCLPRSTLCIPLLQNLVRQSQTQAVTCHLGSLLTKCVMETTLQLHGHFVQYRGSRTVPSSRRYQGNPRLVLPTIMPPDIDALLLNKIATNL